MATEREYNVNYPERERAYAERVVAAMDGEWSIQEYHEYWQWVIVSVRQGMKLGFNLQFTVDATPSRVHIPFQPSIRHVQSKDTSRLVDDRSLRLSARMRPETVAGRLNALLPLYYELFDQAVAGYNADQAANAAIVATLRSVLPGRYETEGELNMSFRTLTIPFRTKNDNGDELELRIREVDGRIARIEINDPPIYLSRMIVQMVLASHTIKKEVE